MDKDDLIMLQEIADYIKEHGSMDYISEDEFKESINMIMDKPLNACY